MAERTITITMSEERARSFINSLSYAYRNLPAGAGEYRTDMADLQSALVDAEGSADGNGEVEDFDYDEE